MLAVITTSASVAGLYIGQQNNVSMLEVLHIMRYINSQFTTYILTYLQKQHTVECFKVS